MLYLFLAAYGLAAGGLFLTFLISPRLALLCALIGLPLLVYATWIEPRRFVVVERSIEISGLTAPVRALLIGDPQPNRLHWSQDRLEAVFAKAVAEKPDIILWVGDYAYDMSYIKRLGWHDPAFIDPRETIAAMSTIDAPMGSYAVLGNHDWWWDGPAVIDLLAQTHIELLQEEVRLATHPGTGAQLWIAGLQDVVTPKDSDPDAVVAKADNTAPIILLSHSPDILPKVPMSVALTLSGHTHGGQIDLPIIRNHAAPVRNHSYVRGYVEDAGRKLFVTSGIGVGGVPARFLRPPEAVILNLVPASAD